jgi:hypothetical protein
MTGDESTAGRVFRPEGRRLERGREKPADDGAVAARPLEEWRPRIFLHRFTAPP